MAEQGREHSGKCPVTSQERHKALIVLLAGGVIIYTGAGFADVSRWSLISLLVLGFAAAFLIAALCYAIPIALRVDRWESSDDSWLSEAQRRLPDELYQLVLAVHRGEAPPVESFRSARWREDGEG